MTRRYTPRRPRWALPADAQTGLESMLQPSPVYTREGPLLRIVDTDTSLEVRGLEGEFQAQERAHLKAEKALNR